jgi:hypothetical protein
MYQHVQSNPAGMSVTIDGQVSPYEWDHAAELEITEGALFFQHDANNLYILIDMTGDTNPDPLLSSNPWGDYFELAFDVDADKVVTANTDFVLSPTSASRLADIPFVAPGTLANVVHVTTNATGSYGFGPTDKTNAVHRFWELSIPRSEITSNNSINVYLGAHVHSQQPYFEVTTPTDMMKDFSGLIEVQMGYDCNGNGIEDAQDIASGTSQDADGDGTPDECAAHSTPAPAGCGAIRAGAFPFMLLCLGLIRFLPRRWD